MKGRKKRFGTQRVALCGLLLAVMIILGWVESLLPMAYGIKLGLSNSVLIFAVYMLDIPTAYVLMVLKVVLSKMLFGRFDYTFMLAISGGFLSLTMMVLFSLIKGIHPVTVSIVGGVSHNLGQILVAFIFFPKVALLGYLPVLMLTGMGFGFLTGICAHRVMKYMKHISFLRA